MRHAYRDVEAPIACVEQSRFSPAQCRSDRVGDFLYGQPVTRDHRAIEFHVEHRRTADLVRLHAARSGDRLQHPHHLVGGLRHLVEIVAVELDRIVAAYAWDQLVEAQLDGLAALVEIARSERSERGWTDV